MSDVVKKDFLLLCKEAESCVKCPKLAEKKAVLSLLNGSLSPVVFFIAEAPGRKGADRTRRPFYGDQSGDNFQLLIDSIGLKREEIFITNAVLCSPRSESGANRKPSKSEIKNCSEFLKRQIELMNPKIIATLGSTALEALKYIENHEFTLKTHVGKILDWNGRKLIPLYH
ncbi:MAG: uracil-DNA glycosylase, partial [Pyrinomonadaceae bacterium]